MAIPPSNNMVAVPASDLYALGATLIQLLTGRSPSELSQREMHIDFRPLVSVEPSLIYWLEKMVEPAVERRPQSAQTALKQ